MFSTSLAALAVAGALTAGSLSVTQPAWQTSYRVALGQVVEQHKPLAVFIGRGQAGYTRLVTEGGLGTDTAKLLKQGYVSLYLDVDTAAGKQTAETFQMTEGVVISDRTGGVMALRHEGTVSQVALYELCVIWYRFSPAVAKVIEDGYRVALVHQHSRYSAANVTGSAGHEDLHAFSCAPN